MVTLQDNGTVLHEGTEVGYLGWHENMIVDVFIDEEYRNQGFATEAVSQMVERVRGDYDRIRVNTVLSPEMETVLKKNGFENKVVNKSVLDFSDIPSVDKPPQEEEIVWYKNLG